MSIEIGDSVRLRDGVMIVGTRVAIRDNVFPEFPERRGRITKAAPPVCLYTVTFPSGDHDFFYEDELVAISPLELLAETAE